VESINLIAFEALMIVGTIGIVLIPQVIYWKRKPSWASKKQPNQEKEQNN